MTASSAHLLSGVKEYKIGAFQFRIRSLCIAVRLHPHSIRYPYVWTQGTYVGLYVYIVFRNNLIRQHELSPAWKALVER